MSGSRRYALYHCPLPGSLMQAGSAWLGWDLISGSEVPQSPLHGLPRSLSDLTRRCARYGFHATLRAPFHPADGFDEPALCDATQRLAASLKPVQIDSLSIARNGRALAVMCTEQSQAISDLAADIVRGSDPWRAPLRDEDRARRRPDRLPQTARAHLDRWGYPWVMDMFRFHMTLTESLTDEEHDSATSVAKTHFGDAINGQPHRIDDLCLCREDEDGRFHLIKRYPLGG